MATRHLHSKIAFLLILATCSQVAIADIIDVRTKLSQRPDTTYLQENGNDLIAVNNGIRQPINSTVFQKTIDGIPLHGGFVTVLLNNAGDIIEVRDNSTEQMQTAIGVLSITDSAAANIVADQLNAKAISKATQLVWFRTDDSAELAWEVTTDLADSGQRVSPTQLVTVVDAATGDILSQTQLDTNEYYGDDTETISGVFPRIVINNNIGPAGSRAYAAQFDAVVALDFGCTGVLIAPNVVLSARHCGAFAGDQVIFGTNSNNGTFTATVQSSTLPDGNGSLLDGGDVAILRLNTNVPANIATPMRLIDATNDLEGQVCAMAGYGFNGVGSQGHQFSSDGRRWGGENIIDRYGSPAGAGGSNIISTDFDNGSNGANTIGGSSPTPIEFEATTAPGDSGGPVMVQIGSEWVIAGVLSGGTTNTSVYGDISWWTGTAIFRSQIESQGGEFADENNVLLGDINLDGSVNLLDVGPFVNLLNSGGFQAEADVNQDGTVNLLDVGPFVDILGN